MEQQNLRDVANALFSFMFIVHEKIMVREQIFKGMNVPPSHMKVVMYLAFESKDPATSPTITEIAQHLNISKSNMTPIIDKLLLEEMIERVEDPNDRRVLRISLTPKAVDMLRCHGEQLKESIQYRIANLSNEDLGLLDTLLPTLTDVLKKL